MTNTETSALPFLSHVAADVAAGDVLLAVDGVSVGSLLVEQTRWASNGEVVLTVWGATRMFEVVVYASVSVRFSRP